MSKAVVKEINEDKQKNKEEKKSKRVTNVGSIMD
jgi:hypothetical protein